MKTKAGTKKFGIWRKNGGCPHFLIILALLGASFILANASFSHASPETATFTSYIVWRSDNEGDYTFNEAALSTPGVYEISPGYATGGIVKTMTASFEFTGKVTLELSADNGLNYVPAVNGVTLAAEEYGQTGFTKGAQIRWRATVGIDSALREVRISYSDTSGVLGGFGEKELSGFKYRKPIYITNASGEGLFNYQLSVKASSSASVDGHHVHCGGRVSAGFTGIRFTAADGETLLSYYREGVAGGLASFYVKVPHIPASGTKIYIYYGNNLAGDLSDGEAVFDFFDDFDGTTLDSEKWVKTVGLEGELDITGSSLRLDSAKIVSKDYEIKDGIIEYAVEATAGYEARLIVRADEVNSQVAYSSSYEGAEHCIAIGDIVKANTAKAISGNTRYDYRVIAKGADITFARFSEGYAEEEALVAFKDTGGMTTGAIGLEIGEGNTAYYDWMRVRRYASDEPLVSSLNAEEEVTLPVFTNVTIAENGDLVLEEGYAEGTYFSKNISSSFETRIMIPEVESTIGQVSVDVSVDGGVTYKTNCINNKYYYASKGDFTEGASLVCRVNLSGAAAAVQGLSFDYEPGDIFIISPSGGEIWAQGYRKEIMWTAQQYESDYPMKVEYSLDGGSIYKTIAKEAENTGSLFWDVPGNISSKKAKVRISDSYDHTVYAQTTGYFSILTQAEYEELTGKELEEEKIEEDYSELSELSSFLTEAGKDPAAEPYELLIKIGDNYHRDRDEDRRASYKAGDIVLVRPAGFNWSDTEKNSFLVIRVDMTKEKAKEIVASKKVKTRKKDSYGNPIYRTIKKRAYKVNLDKFGLGEGRKKNIGKVHRFLKGKVLSQDIMERK